MSSSGRWSMHYGMCFATMMVFSGGCSSETSNPGDVAGGDGGSAADLGSGGSNGDTSADAGGTVTGAAAATRTAETNANCVAIEPFYWELGDAGGVLASGSVGSGAPVASTAMAIASGSKWLFGAYAVEEMGGMPPDVYVPFLNLTSGYIGLDSCPPAGTVDDCLTGPAATPTAGSVGKFDYGNAHHQKLASLLGLGPDDNAALADAVKAQLGPELDLEYTEPEPASGVTTTAEQYARFLRKLLVDSPTPLLLGSLLGQHAVCTNPATCATALFSPITGSPTSTESWHYGLSHWIEDDPVVGDGAFSSGGAFGFYPWVDATRTTYGVLAREVPFTGHNGYDSAVCGRSIRKAWLSGVAQ